MPDEAAETRNLQSLMSGVGAALDEFVAFKHPERIRRHNDMAAYIADAARKHPNLELLLDPTLSICCFRYVASGVADLDRLNRRLHRLLVRENRNILSTTLFNGKLALRPCFVGARSHMDHARSLVEDVLRIGAKLMQELP